MTTDVVPDVPAEGAAVPEPSAPSKPSNIVELPQGTVTLYPEVTLPLGIAALDISRRRSSQVIRDGDPFSDIDMAIIEGGLAEVYLRFGIKEWSFKNAKGFPEPVTPENIERLLPYNGGGREVAEVADALYSGEVFRPFREAQAKLLELMSMEPSTSPSSPNGSTHRTHSKRSSRKNSAAGKRSGGRGH